MLIKISKSYLILFICGLDNWLSFRISCRVGIDFDCLVGNKEKDCLEC